MNTRRAVLIAIGASAAGVAIGAEDSASRWIGTWSGVLSTPAQPLRLRLTIAANGRAQLYSLDQDNQPMPMLASWHGDELELRSKAPHANFRGCLIPDGGISGTWRQAGETPLTWHRGEAAFTAMPVVISQPLTAERLEALRAECKAPAMASAAAHRGGMPLRFATGERSILSGNRVTTEDVWHLGSITKSITATLVARLVDAGQITWDDTVDALLGKAVPDMQAQYRNATFRHLLSHRSGLPGDIPVLRFAGFTLHDSADVIGARRQYASIALGMKPLHALEAAYLYANNGYVVAGAMLEARLGETTEALTQKHVFKPLGLSTAGFGPPGRFGELTQPVGHADDMDMKLLRVVGIKSLKPQSPGMPQTDNPVPLGPAGRAHMSLDDVLRYLEAHRDRTSFLTPASWDVLHTPPFGGNYAMGWVRRADGSLWHNGSNNRWYAEVLFNSSTGLAACAVANEARPAARAAVSRALQEMVAAA